MKIKLTYIAFVILFSFFTFSCMEDLVEPASVKYYTSADLITYFETHGDYINSENNPSIISVDEVYNNLPKYLLMDIRTQSQYQSGHIEGAVNLGIEDILDSLQLNNISLDANKESLCH